jgi:hypothetical protein
MRFVFCVCCVSFFFFFGDEMLCIVYIHWEMNLSLNMVCVDAFSTAAVVALVIIIITCAMRLLSYLYTRYYTTYICAFHASSLSTI